MDQRDKIDLYARKELREQIAKNMSRYDGAVFGTGNFDPDWNKKPICPLKHVNSCEDIIDEAAAAKQIKTYESIKPAEWKELAEKRSNDVFLLTIASDKLISGVRPASHSPEDEFDMYFIDAKEKTTRYAGGIIDDGLSCYLISNQNRLNQNKSNQNRLNRNAASEQIHLSDFAKLDIVKEKENIEKCFSKATSLSALKEIVDTINWRLING